MNGEKMMRGAAFIAALAASFASISLAHAEPMTEEAARAATDNAVNALKAGNPEAVIPLVDPVIATFEDMQKDQTVQCADDLTGALFLSAMQAALMEKVPEKERRAASIVGPDFCAALFLKGFALIDLKRMDEAETFLRRAHEAAPLNAHYLNEYAEWHKAMKQWEKSHELFQEAFGLGEFSTDKGMKKFNQARALRGMAFNEIEMGQLDKAEKNLRKSLKLLPDNAGAKSELQYIADLKKKQKG
jgi:tetratricopeptide (TPR) repeat protein